jgi:hypothetical protein
MRTGTHSRADIVRHVIRADIDGHISADGDGGDDDDGTRSTRDESACEDSRENNEHEPRAKAGKLLRDVQRRLFDTGELVEILVERRLHVRWRLRCHSHLVCQHSLSSGSVAG